MPETDESAPTAQRWKSAAESTPATPITIGFEGSTCEPNQNRDISRATICRNIAKYTPEVSAVQRRRVGGLITHTHTPPTFCNTHTHTPLTVLFSLLSVGVSHERRTGPREAQTLWPPSGSQKERRRHRDESAVAHMPSWNSTAHSGQPLFEFSSA